MLFQQCPMFNEKYQIKTSTKRKKFTEQEDEMLKFLAKQFGTLNWTKISEYMPSRTAKQCRDRYCNYLSEATKDEPWNEEEDEIILTLLPLLGPKWVEISHHIPGRSGNNVKNRWYKHLKKRFSYPKYYNNYFQGHIIQNNQYNTYVPIKMKEQVEVQNETQNNNFEESYQKYTISSLLV